jgi:hypothetical protein
LIADYEFYFLRISMMKLKWVFFIILATLPVLWTQTNVQAANTSQIDSVLSKKVLTEQDLKSIDDYVRNAVSAILNERDLTKIARYREAIVTRKGGPQGQYVQQFNDSAEKYLTEALKSARNLRPAKRQTMVVTNLLILIDGLENSRFCELAKSMLDDENVVVRYWAVRCLSNPNVITQLKSGQAANPNQVQQITEKFKSMVPKSSPEILNLMARYSAAVETQQGYELLLQIADQRIKSYIDWSVNQEIMDCDILKLLESNISSLTDKTNVSSLAQRFAQLYSCAIQRYVNGGNILNASQKSQLITVIVETEEKSIRNMVGTQQNLRKAIEQNQAPALTEEHNRLLGSNTTQGQLSSKYGFNYGKTDSGSIRNAPLTLSNPR